MPIHEPCRFAGLRMLALTGACLLLGAGPASAEEVSTAQVRAMDVGRFETPTPVPPAPWQLVLLGERIQPTRYAIRLWDGVTAIEARADNSMALLARPLTIDLKQTPVLCWRWRVDAVLKTADMTKKAGDDYAARVYVALKLPPQALGFGLRTKLAIARGIYGDHVPDAALNYVWDNRHPQGTVRLNAYTDRTQMIVMRTGNQDAGRWVTERRDVLADARQLFGAFDHQAASLAVAADTDNTHERARSGFADLHFVAPDQACHFPAPSATLAPSP